MAIDNPSLSTAAPWLAIACIAAAALGWSTEYRLLLCIVASASLLFWLQAHIRQRGWEMVSPLVAATLGFIGLAILVLLVLFGVVTWVGVTRGLHD